MTEDLEQRIRRAVHDVGLAEVAQPDHVLRRAGQRARARERNRKFALGGTTFVAVAVAVVGIAVVSGRDTRQEGTSAETGVVSTVTAATPISPAVSPTTPPAADSRWRPIAAHPDGIGWDVAATWIGDRAFVLGNQAYTYDPSDDSWSALAPLPETWTPLDGCSATPASCVGEPIGENPNGFGLIEPIVVWTGEKVLVLGGDLPAQEASDEVPDCEGRGACYPNLVLGANFGYVPAADTWQLLAAPPWFVNARSPHVWTGSELLVWPWDVDGNADPAYAYDPAANTWRQLPTVPVAPRQNAASVWTGTEWIVWGGGNDSGEFADGAAYDPVTDAWRMLSETPISPRKVQGAWTGSEMLVMAGSQGGGTAVCCGNAALGDGAAYNPTTDTWRPLAGTVGHPGFKPLWAGDVLLMFAKGGVIVYDPVAEDYVDVCCDGMAGSATVWTGNEAISFGSYTADRGGGIFTPPPREPDDVSSADESAATVPEGFCAMAQTAAEGHGGLEALGDFPGLSDQQQAKLRPVVDSALEQIETGNGWDTTGLVTVVNEVCDLDLLPVTMVP